MKENLILAIKIYFMGVAIVLLAPIGLYKFLKRRYWQWRNAISHPQKSVLCDGGVPNTKEKP